MADIQLGKDCKLYLNTGTYASPVWTAVDSVVDLSLSVEKGEAEVSRRGSGGFRQFKMTLKDVTMDVTFIRDKDDTAFTALETAMESDDYKELAITDAVDGVGTDYFLALWEPSSWENGQELEEGETVDATYRIVPATIADDVSPAWGSGALPTTRP